MGNFTPNSVYNIDCIEGMKKYLGDGDVDVIVLPTVPRTAHKIAEKISVEEMYGYDVLTVLANIAGIPAISIPCGEISGKKVGLQVMAARGADDLVLDVAGKME